MGVVAPKTKQTKKNETAGHMARTGKRKDAWTYMIFGRETLGKETSWKT